jgi:hypothetical protein
MAVPDNHEMQKWCHPHTKCEFRPQHLLRRPVSQLKNLYELCLKLIAGGLLSFWRDTDPFLAYEELHQQ